MSSTNRRIPYEGADSLHSTLVASGISDAVAAQLVEAVSDDGRIPTGEEWVEFRSCVAGGLEGYQIGRCHETQDHQVVCRWSACFVDSIPPA
ncbi:MAG: hypothetical protein K0M78_03275 [Brevundimonas sp.]|nr:hypothetical protein [Brevundimonas sp.]